ncbi:MAG: site-specific integrase [Eubacterium sp.]|nr:site-specific integrase [Eubacterium sp.]
MASAKKLPSGSWRVNLYIGKTADGKRQYKSFTADTKKQAEYMAAQYNVDRKEKAEYKLTLHNAIERYIESKRNILSPSTVRGYYDVLDNYCSQLMQMNIGDLNQETIQIAINSMAVKYSPKTCRNTHGLISAALKVYRPELTLNTTLPQKAKREIYVPDEKEIAEIYEMSVGTINEIPVFLAAECGLRASEISALRIENISLSYIDVKEALVIGDDNKEHLKAPKSSSGYRKVPISGRAYEYLISHADKNGRICPRRGAYICNNWSTFKKQHGLNANLNFHALRHHYASKCILLGIPQKYIAELMGHSSTDMIEKVYQHIFPSAMEEYANQLRQQMSELCNTKSNI